MPRCFIAFEPSPSTLDYLEDYVRPLHARLKEAGWPLRLVPRENWHCTLLFFPALDEAGQAAVWTEIAAEAQAGVWRELPFAWEGPSLWPLPRRPNLLCLAASPFPQAAAWPLQARVEEAPFTQARAPRLHRYRPHLTVMRFRKGPPVNRSREWAALRETLPPFDGARLVFDRVSLFLSATSPQQPIYPRAQTAPLQPTA